MKMKILAQNKKAKFEYEWLDSFEAGIILLGGEVKAVRSSHISINEAYVKIYNDELWLKQAHISVPSYVPNHLRFEEVSDRKLLMNKQEISKIKSKILEKGLTLLCVELYETPNSKKIKCKLVLARGRKLYDKKQYLKEKTIDRDMKRQCANL